MGGTVGISGNVAVGDVVGISDEVAVGGIVGINGEVVVGGIFGSGGKVAVGAIVTVELGCGSAVVVNVIDVICPFRFGRFWVVVLLFVSFKLLVCCPEGNHVLAKIPKVS